MTNFDYISEQIKVGKMNAEQMEEFIFDGTLCEFHSVAPVYRIKFLELRYIQPIKPCPFCGSTLTRVLPHPYSEKFFVTCDDCDAQSGVCRTEYEAIESWNSIRREIKE